MKLNKWFCFSLALNFVLVAYSAGPKKVKMRNIANLTWYVDPTIGTGGHGHVFLGADVPFGLVQLVRRK